MPASGASASASHILLLLSNGRNGQRSAFMFVIAYSACWCWCWCSFLYLWSKFLLCCVSVAHTLHMPARMAERVRDQGYVFVLEFSVSVAYPVLQHAVAEIRSGQQCIVSTAAATIGYGSAMSSLSQASQERRKKKGVGAGTTQPNLRSIHNPRHQPKTEKLFKKITLG